MGRKRSNGEGSIYPRSRDKRWIAAITIGRKPNGSPDRKEYVCKTQREAVLKLREAQNALAQGRPVKFESQTLRVFLTRWLESQRITVKPGTLRSYAWAVDKHLIPGLGSYQLQKLSPQELQQFINEKNGSGLGAKSVKIIRDTLRAALNQAMKWGLVYRNVATLVMPPRQQREQSRVWSASEANAFLELIAGHELEGIFRLALCFGVRQGEILALTWDDIDFEGRRFYIRATQQRVDRSLVSVAPKTPSSRRVVPLALGLGSLLAARRLKQQEQRELAAGDWEESNIIFTTSRGTRLDANNLRRSHRSLVHLAELPYIPFHSMRKTAASLLKERGLTDQEIATILGHSSTETTREFYLHATPDSEERAVRALEEVFIGVAVSVAVKDTARRVN